MKHFFFSFYTIHNDIRKIKIIYFPNIVVTMEKLRQLKSKGEKEKKYLCLLWFEEKFILQFTIKST